MNKIHDLARHLECLLLRFLEPQHRGSAIRYTYNGKTLFRSSIVVDVFKTLLEGDTDKMQDLLQALKEEICIIRTGKSGGDVQLSDEMNIVFQDLYQSLRDCKDANVDRDAALRALAGIADYLPCHPIEAMLFVLKYIPTFVIQGGEATRNIEKKMLAVMASSGFQTAKQLLVGFLDTSRMTFEDGYVSDMFRIVFTLYYWPYAKAETNDSLCVLPDYSTNLIHREHCRCIMNTFIPATLLGRIGIRDFKLRHNEEVTIFRDHYLPHLLVGQGTFSVKVNEQGEPDAALISREEAFDDSKAFTKAICKKHELKCQNPSEGVGGTYQTTQPASNEKVTQKTQRHLIRIYGVPSLRRGSEFVFCDVGCAQNRPMWIASNLFGFCTIGIEIDELRSKAAADTALDMMKSKFAKNSQVAFIKADAEESISLVGIHAFFVWNEAFTLDVTLAIVENISNSLDHKSLPEQHRKFRLPQALIIIGMKRLNRVLELFDERFLYKECDQVDLQLAGTHTSNRVKFFQVELRSDYVPTIPEDPPLNVLKKSKLFFRSANARKREYERVIKAMGPLASDSDGVITRGSKAKKVVIM
jgi:hypothetical protein